MSGAAGVRTKGTLMGTDQLPPFDTDAEAGALACVLSAHGNADELLAQLQLEHFDDVRHETIFRALKCAPNPDPVGLVQWLRDKGELENAGGIEYVAGLPDKTPSPANFPTFLEAVLDRATRRAVIAGCTSVIEAARNPAIPLSAVRHAAQTAAGTVGELTGKSLADELASRRFDLEKQPPRIEPVFTLQGRTIATAKNISTTTAAIKAGKSAVHDAMMAATMVEDAVRDCFGFESANPEGRAVLHFDSEQSPEDHWALVRRAIRRAGLDHQPPWLVSYCLTGTRPSVAWNLVREAIRMASQEFPGIHTVLLDGAADLVSDVNDAAECNDFVAELMDTAIRHSCHINGVIHFNPGGEKSRGHLGSQLERKAETNLALEKDESEVTVIYSLKNRRAGIPKNHGPCFVWSDEAGMHVTAPSRASKRDAALAQELRELAEEIFSDRLAKRHCDLVESVQKATKKCERTAKDKVREMKRLGVIELAPGKLYTLVRNANT